VAPDDGAPCSSTQSSNLYQITLRGVKDKANIKKHRSKSQKFKTGEAQRGVLSPTLFNLYTSDLPLPPEGVSMTTYANDMIPAASHSNYHIAEDRLQPYLNDILTIH